MVLRNSDEVSEFVPVRGMMRPISTVEETSRMLEYVFWATLALLIYVYFGYPIALWVLSRSNGRSAVPHAQISQHPQLTLVISAYNEEDCIRGKIENSLALTYPTDRFDIIVVSDASDDATDAIVGEYISRNVQLLRQPRRVGKTIGLNQAVHNTSAEIVVFSDANAHYKSDALEVLAARFSDPAVGAVIGESSYERPDTASGQSESLYWRYETAIKTWESVSGSVVGGDGAIYAVRRRLYKPMAASDLSDFVNPLEIVRSGYTCAYESRAVSYEDAADSFGKEYRRKVRIVNRAWRGLWKMRDLLNPCRFGFFSLKLWSHKVLRWLVPVMLVTLLLVNIAIVDRGSAYLVTLVGQALFYALAIIGYTMERRADLAALFRIPYYFCLVNVAAAVALWELIVGKSYTTWNTARS